MQSLSLNLVNRYTTCHFWSW